jgi:dihydrofolate synthase/folylpolyglutamate synthase
MTSIQNQTFRTDPSYLHWLIQQQQSGVSLGLERMQRLLEVLGNPQESCPSLHIAGTNGKGSVAAFSESLLRKAGKRVGLYTSPHLVDFRERIRFQGEMISLEALEEGIARLQLVTRGWDLLPTFFELTTALAFDYFARQECDAVVLETGLGGRLDATNLATHKIATAITPIGIDHQEWLGPTLADIAREKAGIIRPTVPLVIAPQRAEAMEVLLERASEVGAPTIIVQDAVAPEIPLGLAGSYQRWNAAVALKLVEQGAWNISQELQYEALRSVSWPGRFQRCLLAEGEEMVLDGAHNPAAAEQLVATWREIFAQQKCTLIFGSLFDKEGERMLRILEPIASSIILVAVNSPRAASPLVLRKAVPSATICPSLREVLEKKIVSSNRSTHFSSNVSSPILVTGSLFLVGEALSLLQGKEHASSLQ